MKVILGDKNGDKKVQTEIFISKRKIVILETNSDAFVDDIIKSFMKKYNCID